MRLFSMVDFPMPWEPLTTKKEGVLKALRWGELMKSLMYSSSTGRAGAGSVLSSLCPAFLGSFLLLHEHVHGEARKEPLNESLENQHYDAPCAQQSPTSFNGLRRKSLAGCVRAWPLGKTNRPGASSTCLTKMYLRNVEDKGQYIGSVNLCQTGFGIEGCLICKTKQEPQRLTSINTEFEANNSTSLNNRLVEFEPEPKHRKSDLLNNYPLHSIRTLSQQPQQHI